MASHNPVLVYVRLACLLHWFEGDLELLISPPLLQSAGSTSRCHILGAGSPENLTKEILNAQALYQLN